MRNSYVNTNFLQKSIWWNDSIFFLYSNEKYSSHLFTPSLYEKIELQMLSSVIIHHLSHLLSQVQHNLMWKTSYLSSFVSNILADIYRSHPLIQRNIVKSFRSYKDQLVTFCNNIQIKSLNQIYHTLKLSTFLLKLVNLLKNSR